MARTLDNDRQHLTEVLRRAAQHKGTAFVEIYQNCNVFNDGAFDLLREKSQGKHNQIRLEEGQPIVFDDGNRCVRVGDNGRYEIALTAETDPASIVVHDPHGRPSLAFALAHLSHGPDEPSCHRRVPRDRAPGLRAGDPASAAVRDRTPRRGRPGDAASLRGHLDGGVATAPAPTGGGLRVARKAEPCERLGGGGSSIRRSSRDRSGEHVRATRRARARSRPRRGSPGTRWSPGYPICSRTGEGSSGRPLQSEPAPTRNPRSSSVIISVAGSSPATLNPTR